MKYLHRLAAVASAAFFIASSAFAQSGDVTNHAFPIGKGVGVNGFTSLLCAAGQVALGQTAADPICTTPSFSFLSGSNSAAQIAGSAASHAVPVDVAGTPTWKVVPDCQDTAGNHINYTQSTDAFSCGSTSSGSGSGVNVQSGNYTIANTDCGGVVSMTGAMKTVTLPAVAGFSSTCLVTINNANTTRAQLMSGFPADMNIPNVTCGGASNFCLFPAQAISVQIVNGAWTKIVPTERWRKASPQFFANPGGSDSNDCLATGTANACLTIQHAVDLSCFATDSGNTNQLVQLDDGTYNPGFQIVTHCLGQNSVVVTGNHATPANVVIQASTGTIVYAKDKGFLALDGMKLQSLASGVLPLACGQYANVDVNGPIIVTHTPGASLFSATDMCTLNLNVALTIQDTAAPSSAVTLYNVSNNARIQLSGVMTFTGTWSFSFDGCFAQAGGVIDLNAGSITGGTQTGTRFLSQLNGVIYGGAATKCPGNAAGSTTLGGQAS